MDSVGLGVGRMAEMRLHLRLCNMLEGSQRVEAVMAASTLRCAEFRDDITAADRYNTHIQSVIAAMNERREELPGKGRGVHNNNNNNSEWPRL